MTKINKEGWENKKLGEVCEIYQPRTLSTDKLSSEGKYPVYGANGIIGFYSEFNHEGPEVLLTCRGATCGTINVSQPFSWINGNAMVIHRKSEELSFDFLRYLMLSLDYSMIITGAAQPQITRQKLAPTKISFPPLPIQQRIVEELDEINTIISAKKQQLSKLDELAQSIFYNMFGDPVANEKGWEVKELGKVCTKLTDGSHNPPQGVDKSDFLMLSSKNVTFQGFTFEEPRYLTKEQFHSENKRTNVSKGDVFLVIVGAGVGKCCVYKFDIPITLQRSVAVLKPDVSVIQSIYLNAFLQTAHDFICSNANGAAQKGIYLKQLSKIHIPLPPLHLQETFAARVSAIEEEKAAIAASIEKMQTLLDARMQEYFG